MKRNMFEGTDPHTGWRTKPTCMLSRWLLIACRECVQLPKTLTEAQRVTVPHQINPRLHKNVSAHPIAAIMFTHPTLLRPFLRRQEYVFNALSSHRPSLLFDVPPSQLNVVTERTWFFPRSLGHRY